MAEKGNNPLYSRDSEDFLKTLDKTLNRIAKIESATDKANDRLTKFAATFDDASKSMKQFITLNNKVNGTKVIMRTESVNSRGGGSARRELTKQEQAAKKATAAERERNKQINKTNQDISATIKVFNDVKKLNPSAVLSDTAKGVATLSGGSLALSAAVGLCASAVAGLAVATSKAHQNSVEYNKALKQMGVELNRNQKSTMDVANGILTLSNRWENAMNTVGKAFEPVMDMLVDFGNWALGWSSGAESENRRGTAIASVSNNAAQSGFSLGTSNALGQGTYNAALLLAEGNADRASEVSAKLADAWLSGSAAAKEYGVVVNDNVLTGYMANVHGIDIANVEITDAMKQYYRYMLAMEQAQASLTSDGKAAMQDMVGQWTKLGIEIDKTKNKLFSFDEVIQLAAVDTAIPKLTGSLDANLNPTLPEYTGGGNGGNKKSIDGNTDATDTNTDSIDGNTDAVGGNTGAVDSNTVAINNLSQSVEGAVTEFSVAAGGIGGQIVGGGQIVSNMFANVFARGTHVISATANSAIDNIINISQIRMNQINQTAMQGQMAVGQTTMAGIGAVNQTGNAKIIDITERAKAANTEINTNGQSWLTKIQNLGNSILDKMKAATGASTSGGAVSSMLGGVADAVGLGGHANVIGGAVGGAVTGAKASGLVGATTGAAKGAVGGAASNVKAFISNPLDLVTEGADLIHSLKGTDGKYDWSKLPGNLFGMISSSIVSPIKANTSGYGLLGGMSYVGMETLGDINNLVEVGADALGLNGLSSAADYTGNIVDAMLGDITGDEFSRSALLASRALEALAADKKYSTDWLNEIMKGQHSALIGDNREETWENIRDWYTSEALLGGVTDKEYIESRLASAVGFGKIASGLDTSVPQLYYDYMKSNGVSSSGSGFANGGIGTREINNASLFEGNKKEAVIPLETQAGVDYLANAMRQAVATGDGTGSAGTTQVYLTLSGVNIADNDAQWQKVGEKIAEVIEVQKQRRGDLNYGSSF